jgi:hypothetical protein
LVLIRDKEVGDRSDGAKTLRCPRKAATLPGTGEFTVYVAEAARDRLIIVGRVQVYNAN